ncbi:hypothetical protein [Bosea sp. BIWAKO-01]|uniref:hypothetical protein n=1 Tax=Bosea sp. BIWAKO-01 TaxID=506668 RepID=UPI000852AFE3|nr:hypothetical protein [Bosea sp. BIWAKO-01]
MRKFILVAAAALGFGSFLTSMAQAAPIAGLKTIENPNHIEQIKHGGHGYHGHKGWHGSRHWNRGRSYGRHYGGPPPHARAYGRRAHDAGYYRYR